MKCEYLIVSDIHLGSKDCRAEKVLEVLKKVKAKRIIIAGDLFDHHNLYRFKKTHWQVLSKIRKLSKKVKIIYLIGNHCFLKAEFMSILLGLKCDNEFYIELNNKKILVVHGDIFDIYFSKYKLITNIVIKIYYFFRKYTPFADDFFRVFKSKSNSFVEKSSKVKENALKYIQKNDFDRVICGHTHVPEVSEQYINLGSFCEDRCSYLTIDKKGNIKLDFI